MNLKFKKIYGYGKLKLSEMNAFVLLANSKTLVIHLPDSWLGIRTDSGASRTFSAGRNRLATFVLYCLHLAPGDRGPSSSRGVYALRKLIIMIITMCRAKGASRSRDSGSRSAGTFPPPPSYFSRIVFEFYHHCRRTMYKVPYIVPRSLHSDNVPK